MPVKAPKTVKGACDLNSAKIIFNILPVYLYGLGFLNSSADYRLRFGRGCIFYMSRHEYVQDSKAEWIDFKSWPQRYISIQFAHGYGIPWTGGNAHAV